MAQEYQGVFSIGSQCLTGTMLQNARLKKFSGPFDWIFSSLGMVCDCIEDDFRDFLDPQNLEPIPLTARPGPGTAFCNHKIYQHRHRLHAIFNHSDPTVPEVYDYLVRCVGRFRAALATAESNLLLAICEPDRASEAEFHRLVTLLDQRPQVEALVIVIGARAEVPQLRLVEECGRHRRFIFHPTSVLAGIQFAEHIDNVFLRAAISELAWVSAAAE